MALGRTARGTAAALGLALAAALPAAAQTTDQTAAPILAPYATSHPVFAEHGMVATQDAIATRVGVDILERGGNAVDAAVAVGFALAVTLPRAGNLGGGGFMLVHAPKDGETVAVDYRETAPQAATRDMFLDAEGKVDTDRSRYSHLAVGVPGTVAGLALALERFGTMDLSEVLQPAIRLARDGFPVSPDLAQDLLWRAQRLLRWPASARAFFKPDGSLYAAGETLRQPDLAWSLEQIARHGPGAFYHGPIGELIAAEMRAEGGLITADDLAAYRPRLREPVWGEYRGYRIASMPPPSSGGVHLIEILNILEGYPIGALGPNGSATLHLMVEAMKRAYADRSRYLGDPDVTTVPVAGLTDKAYAASLRAGIDATRATPSSQIAPGTPPAPEGPHTTHFSVVDGDGMVVSNTYTINFSFGTGIVAPGTGILLNNEMDDFSSKPGVPNAYGLIGGDANAIAPGKRPLSSMTPTIVFRGDDPVLATGSPGGSRIITTVLQIVMNVVDHGMNVAMATAAPRIHHQWLPDVIRIEPGIAPDVQAALEAMGHTLELGTAMGSTQSIAIQPDGRFGASDPRTPGGLAAGN